MDDGCWTGHGVRISTNNFNSNVVKDLSDLLKFKFDLNNTLQAKGSNNQFEIIY